METKEKEMSEVWMNDTDVSISDLQKNLNDVKYLVEQEREAFNNKIKELQDKLVSNALDKPFDATTEYHYQKRIKELETLIVNGDHTGLKYLVATSSYKIFELEANWQQAIENNRIIAEREQATLEHVKELENKFKDIETHNNIIADTAHAMREHCEDLESKLKICKDALEFYANKNNWNGVYSDDFGSGSMVQDSLDCDFVSEEWIGGNKARKALSQIAKQGDAG